MVVKFFLNENQNHFTKNIYQKYFFIYRKKYEFYEKIVSAIIKI